MLSLTACQSQNQTKNSTSLTQTSKKSSLLKKEQSQKLDRAMKDYGQKNNEHYQKYAHQKLVLKNGRIYPDIFKKANFFLNDKKISIGWDPYGKHHYDYEVLAMYNANLSGNNHKTFLFCRHDKKPIVLIDSDQSNSKNINLKQSPDKGLDSEFVGIMNGFNK